MKYDWLLGRTIKAVGHANGYGTLYPILILDNDEQVFVQSDDEGNNGGVLIGDKADHYIGPYLEGEHPKEGHMIVTEKS